MSRSSELIDIVCNCCLTVTDRRNDIFFITSCSHIFCGPCLKNNRNFCKVCMKLCNTLQINGDLPEEVKMFFKVRYHEMLFDKFDKIQNFQMSQSKILHDALKKYDMKVYGPKKARLAKNEEKLNALRQRVEHEEKLIDRMTAAKNSGKIPIELFKIGKEQFDLSFMMRKKSKTKTPTLLEKTLKRQHMKSVKIQKKHTSKSPSIGYASSSSGEHKKYKMR